MIARFPATSFEAFSPRIVSTLFAQGHQINVWTMSDVDICVETTETLPPGDAYIETRINDELVVTRIRLLEGIDPKRDEQPIRVYEDR
jgi:hypothetical protein